MDRIVASSKSAGAPGFHRGHEDRSAEGTRIEAPKAQRGWGIGIVVPFPNQLGGPGLGSVVSSPSGVRGGAPAANAFLAYFKPTVQPIKSSIFRKRPLNRSIRGHGHWTISSCIKRICYVMLCYVLAKPLGLKYFGSQLFADRKIQ